MTGTTLDYQNAQLSELAKVAKQDLDARNQQIWREALGKYEKLAGHQANFSLILSWCGGSLSMAAIDHLMANCPPNLGLDLTGVTDERPKLIDAILAARQWPNPAQERKRLQYLTRVQLLDELARLVTKEEYSKFTAAELKAGLAEHRAVETKAQFYFDRFGMRWPRLGTVTRPPDFVTVYDTATYLKDVAKSNVRAFRFYVSKYGPEQVEKYLNQVA